MFAIIAITPSGIFLAAVCVIILILIISMITRSNKEEETDYSSEVPLQSARIKEKLNLLETNAKSEDLTPEAREKLQTAQTRYNSYRSDNSTDFITLYFYYIIIENMLDNVHNSIAPELRPDGDWNYVPLPNNLEEHVSSEDFAQAAEVDTQDSNKANEAANNDDNTDNTDSGDSSDSSDSGGGD